MTIDPTEKHLDDIIKRYPDGPWTRRDISVLFNEVARLREKSNELMKMIEKANEPTFAIHTKRNK